MEGRFSMTWSSASSSASFKSLIAGLSAKAASKSEGSILYTLTKTEKLTKQQAQQKQHMPTTR